MAKEVLLTSKATESCVGFFEQLPPGVISSVFLNDELRQGTGDRRLEQWFNPDYLIRCAAVFAIGGENFEMPRLQGPTIID